MFKALVLSQIRIVFSSLFRSSGTKKMNMAMKVGIGLLAVYVIGCIFMLFGMIGAASCLPLHQAGLDWFYFSLMGGISILLNIIGGIFASKTVLFDAKDNELLLSMPIPPFLILAGRMLSLLFWLTSGRYLSCCRSVRFMEFSWDFLCRPLSLLR